MDPINELGNDIAVALLADTQMRERFGRTELFELMVRLRTALEPISSTSRNRGRGNIAINSDAIVSH